MTAIPLKVVIVGEIMTGKTCIAASFVDSCFSMEYSPTVPAIFKNKEFQSDDNKVDLAIWDTAGQEQYRTITQNYYHDANIALIVFDVTQRSTYETVETWVTQVNSLVNDVIIVLIGNKSDLADKRQVQSDEATNLAEKLGITYIETSAATGSGIELVFETAIRSYIENYVKPNMKFQQTITKLQPDQQSKKKKRCCK